MVGVQKISAIVQWQTTPFLIYSFVDLRTVAFYGNYTIITDKLSQLINTFLESTGASIGNLIAEKNLKKIKDVFWELLSLRYLIGGIISFSVYILISPFISLWIGSQYILDTSILILITLNIFISYTRGGVMQFLYGFGLFYDTWAPVVEIVINLGIAIIGGFIWGLKGILLGGIISQLLIVGIWKPYFLFTKGFEEKAKVYWFNWIKYMSAVLISWWCSQYVADFVLSIDPYKSFLSWIIYAILIVLFYSICCWGLLYVFTSSMKRVVHRFIKKNTMKR